MEAVREHWTDDRMDDLVRHVDRGFVQADTRFAEAHDDLIDLRKELGEKCARQELSELRSEINQRFDKLQNMLLTGFLTFVLTLIATRIA